MRSLRYATRIAVLGTGRVYQLVSEHTTYLWGAETVLRRNRRPLRAHQIVSSGIADGFFADMDLSATPHKAMLARLSADILKKKALNFILREPAAVNSNPAAQSGAQMVFGTSGRLGRKLAYLFVRLRFEARAVRVVSICSLK